MDLNIVSEGEMPAAGEKKLTIWEAVEDFAMGNSPPQAENFGVLSLGGINIWVGINLFLSNW